MLDELAQKYRVTQAEIALAWLLSSPGVLPLVKASSEVHINEIIRSGDLKLSQSEILALTEKFPIQVGISDCTPPRSSFIK